MKQLRHLKYHQSGQGLVEYAILLLLTITLVIGGIELTATALASGKAKDAAEAATNEFGDLNEQRIKLQKNQQAYLEKLNAELQSLSPSLTKTISVKFEDPATSKAQFESVNVYEFIAGTPQDENIEFKHFVDFLDYFANKAIFDGSPIWFNYRDFFFPERSYFITKCLEAPTTPTVDPESPEPESICTPFEYPELDSILTEVDGILDPDGNGQINDADSDGTITRDELLAAIDLDYQFNIKQKVLNLSPSNIDSDIDSDPDLHKKQKIARYKTLILLDQVALSLMPLDPRLPLSESELLIGDHNPLLFIRPNCIDNGDGTTDYDNGLPGSLIDVNEDGLPDNIGHFTFADNSLRVIYDSNNPVDISGDYPAVYLFNPKPIDAGSCQGVDGNRDNRTRVSVLVNGYGYHLDANFVTGMPKVHEAYLSQYINICLNGENEYRACGSANVTQQLLKPTGKLCLSSAINPTVDSCPDIDADYIDSSGYYFWGVGDASSNPGVDGSQRFQWHYAGTQAPEFRPTFQLVCNGGRSIDNDPDVIGFASVVSKSLVVNNACLYNDFFNQGVPHHVRSVRVNVRYRSVFDSFLTDLKELQDDGNLGLVNYFYDPSNLRRLPNGAIGVPIAGSELGPKAENRNPTVKPFKDFRGCYEVQVETNSVSSCN